MGVRLKAFREARKSKKELKKDPYDKQELILQRKLLETEPGTEQFRELQAELKNVVETRGNSRESKRRIAKGDKASIILKILGIGGTVAGMITVAKFERDGMMYTGEKRTIMDSLTRTAAKFIDARK